MNKKILSLLLCLLFMLSMALPAYADETEPEEVRSPQTLSITTEAEFLAFAEKCRLDTYSQNLIVSLDADLDLTGHAFSGVPIFSGIFQGNGHTITGLNITLDGSMQGFFRYLTATAQVQDLHISGTIQPGGSKAEIGAVAGRNEGKIQNCDFTGTLSGSDYAGGIAGTNGVTGVIENCRTRGEIHGSHFVGGIAGENSGVIRNCINEALVNTTPQQNSVDISDITMDTLTNTENVNTVTDIGGIAGISSGVIRTCDNHANIGYPHMGYNIGGIAGTQTGYIADCKNYGSIQGRKEIGGITGQMEPVSLIEYTEDALQLLQKQLNTMSGLVKQASGNAQNIASDIASQLEDLQDQTQDAKEAIDTLFPDANNPGLPDWDTILAAYNTLSTTMDTIPETLDSIVTDSQTTLRTLNRDLKEITGQVSMMGQTIGSASDTTGGSISDISDLDTPDQLAAKVESCFNYGSILADLNAGGIAGAMAVETDLDILEDWSTEGDTSMNYQAEIRAVILDCHNSGRITASKQNVGGITGWQSLGLVKHSGNTGPIDGSNASYAGGIAGRSTGYLRANYVKCEIQGKTYVGGIAGSGTVVTDSLAQVILTGAREKQGAILGYAEDSTAPVENPIYGNRYLCVDADYGAIDGISYSQIAEPIDLDGFRNIENLPESFQNATVHFVFEDGTRQQVKLPLGEDLDTGKIPAIPEKDGFSAKWEGLQNAKLQNILFDMTFEAVYTACRTVIQTEQTRENGLPILLAEGMFTDSATISITESSILPTLSAKEALLEVWEITMSEESDSLRLLLPAGVDAEHIKLYTSETDGVWEEIVFLVDGSYLVFPTASGSIHLALVQTQTHKEVWILAGIGLLLIAAAAAFSIRNHRKTKTNSRKTQE